MTGLILLLLNVHEKSTVKLLLARKWETGLVVWFSLRVREVSGSISPTSLYVTNIPEFPLVFAIQMLNYIQMIFKIGCMIWI